MTRRKKPSPVPLSPAEVAIIDMMIGTHYACEIRDWLASATGHERSVAGVEYHMRRLFGTTAYTGLTSVTVARLLGVSQNTVNHWLHAGMMPHARIAVGSRTTFRISNAGIEEFIRDHWRRLDPARMPRGYLRSKVEFERRCDRYLHVNSAGRVLGYSPQQLKRFRREGRIAMVPLPYRGVGWAYHVAVDELRRFRMEGEQ